MLLLPARRLGAIKELSSSRNGPESRGTASPEVLRIAKEMCAANAGSYSATRDRVNQYPKRAGAL